MSFLKRKEEWSKRCFVWASHLATDQRSSHTSIQSPFPQMLRHLTRSLHGQICLKEVICLKFSNKNIDLVVERTLEIQN